MNEAISRALVVEDDQSWQQILTEILTDLGLAVDLTDNLDEVTGILRSAPHRLAVVDLSLEGGDYHNQDGLQVLEAIRRQDPGCLSILLTGFATVELAVKVLTEYNAFTCLRKETFRRAEFRKVVGQALSAAPASRPAAAEQGNGTAAPRPGRAAQSVGSSAAAENGAALVVEDDAGWRTIVAELLAEEGPRVQVCSSYGEALSYIRRGAFSLAIVDLSLASSIAPSGNVDGYRVLAGTHAAGIPTIVVSGTATPEHAERAYTDYGIAAFFEKQAFDRIAFRRRVAEVLAVARGPGAELLLLTQSEREVLKLLAQGLTNKEIATALVISTNTVKHHLKAIFEKLGVNTRAAATAKALNAGLW